MNSVKLLDKAWKYLGMGAVSLALSACYTAPGGSQSSSSSAPVDNTPSSSSSSVSSTSSTSGNNSGGVAPITVQDNQILFGGQADSIAGVSLFWSNTGWGAERFYNADAVAYVKNAWNADLVRIALGVDPTSSGPFGDTPSGAYLDNSEANNTQTQYDMVTTVIDAAIANDMYVIVDWHSHHAEDFTSDAIEFFSQISAQYGNYNNIIYEVYNEPLQVSWSDVIKPYAEQVIQAIRQNDPDNLVVVGTPTWSQDVDEAANDPITRFDNIAYTLHFYADTHLAEEDGGEGALIGKARQALSSGIPLFVTEWGSVSADGDGGVNEYQTRKWMDFLRQNNISHANWSLHDKEEGASILQPGAASNGGWQDGDLTESGRLIRDIIRNW